MFRNARSKSSQNNSKTQLRYSKKQRATSQPELDINLAGNQPNCFNVLPVNYFDSLRIGN
jgi:hypothetical protein